MPSIRKIQKVMKSRPTLEGAGVHLRRAFGFHDENAFDPFLLLDDFRSDDPRKYLPGFPWHPHRGIETITYMLYGSAEHGDSLGNKGVIGPGDVQWMTAGSGIIHQEMPKGDPEGRMGGFQLWANLPARMKMMDPRYRDIGSDSIPEVELYGTKIKVVAGRVGDVRGPVTDIVIDPEYLDVRMPPNSTFDHPNPPGHTVLAYLYKGKALFEEDITVPSENVILFGDGASVRFRTGDLPASFLLISGKPLKEPVAWGGPIVMNTQAELEQAFTELRSGKFIRSGNDPNL
ncbi:MAG: pirin family protein [Candidatus Thermoplasmatota archaeon]|nr:pirin family protein [Candidatus Thermoplasmatota archaeon]